MKFTAYLIFFAIFLGILTPALFTDGMFMDGTIYSVVSRNLAEGNGSFWDLHFSGTMMSNFNEHPPLAIYLGSLSFQLLGDTIFAERLFSLLTGIAAFILMLLIHHKLNLKNDKNISVLLLFIWLMFPLVNWTYANNMLENTMTVFILLSAFFVFKSFSENRFIMLCLAGFSLSAALLSKGLPALFVWSIIFFYYLVFRKINFKRMFVDTLVFIFSTALPIIILFVFSEAGNESLSLYFNKQILGSFEHVVTVDSRFFIVGSLLNEMIIPLVLIAFLFILSKIKKVKLIVEKQNLKYSLFFFLITLSGILPIMVSMKQRSFYIVPALPFLAFSFYFLIKDLLLSFPNFLNFFKKKFFVPLSYVLITTSIVLIFLLAGKSGRDHDKLADIYKITELIPPNSDILICKSLYSDWSLYAYMQRYGKISLSVKSESDYLLIEDECSIDSAYQEINLNLHNYSLYKKKAL